LVIIKGKLVSENRISYMVDQMTTDKLGRIWMATRNNHLIVFETHPEKPSQYLQLLKDYTKELPEMSPRCITIDTSGNVWIGTRYHGVYRLELDNFKIRAVTQFGTQNGMTDNFVYSINCDASNTIWAGTQTGLDKIFLRNGHYIIGNVSKSNNFFQSVHRIIVARNKIIWALTGEGSIMKITPSQSKYSSNIPEFLFTSLQINNLGYADSAKILSYRQNNLSFTVAALSFLDEKSIRYSYLLEGSTNNTWSKPSNNSSFNFINLSPGHYILKVKADFPEALYPSEMILYPFTIQPPWWETWWFRMFIALLTIVVLISVIRLYYTRKLEKQKAFLEKQQAIEKERTRIATDMHDDLGAGLSRIKFLSETIGIKKQRQIPFEEDITKIREYSHEMIDKMGEIVWALNEKNDSLSDLLSYTRSYTVEYFSQHGIQCTIDSPEDLPSGFVSGEFRRNIFLTVKEALHNIVKHSQADHVCIEIKTGKKLNIVIKDNGIGFDKKNIRKFSNGLQNMKKRMEDIGGAMEIIVEGGTRLIFTVPLP
ncbi:MAG TPA: ATP-binding protein, partial [Chitinophagaceae bacterium]|nr:ATP-binding protein [Chitinophagaceae bacterium]